MERKRNGDLALTGMVDATKWIEVEGCYIQVSRSDLKSMKGTIFGICPDGLMSPVAARIVGHATSWQPTLSSSMVVEIRKELSEEVVVDIYISIGDVTSGRMELGYVQFMSHKGLCHALDHEAVVGDQIITVEPCDREFVMEWKQCSPKEGSAEEEVVQKTLKARMVNKGESCEGDEDEGSATSSRVYCGEGSADRVDVPWIKIKGRKRRGGDKKSSVRFEGSVVSAKGSGDHQGSNPLSRYIESVCPREDVERNERCSSSSDSTGQI